MSAKLTHRQATRPFVLRTNDPAWIERNGGQVDDVGRVTVQVPADEVTEVTFAGRTWLRYQFRDVPGDALNAFVMCPAEWVS